MKTYKKKHKSQEAMNNHIAKIKARGGSYRITGNTLEYGFVEPSKDTSIKAKNTTDLIIEAGGKGYRKVKVVFYPQYEKKLHQNLKNKEILACLKKSKTEILDIIEDTSDIVYLLKNKKDVKSIKFSK